MNYRQEILGHRRFLGLLACLVAVNVVVFGLTDPFNASAAVVLVGFIVGLLNVIVITYLALAFLRTVFPILRPSSKKILIALASFELIMLALASLGQLTVWATVVIVLVWLVAYFYSSYFIGSDGS